MNKTKKILVWVFRSLASIGFLLASLGKLTSNPQVIQMFKNWGYPDRFYLIIGILELSGAILLLVPKVSKYAAIGLIIIMIGAFITHLLHDPIQEILRPLIFTFFLGAILYISRTAKHKPVS